MAMLEGLHSLIFFIFVEKYTLFYPKSKYT